MVVDAPQLGPTWPTYRDGSIALGCCAAAFLLCAWLSPMVSLPVLAAYVLGFGMVVASGLGVACSTPKPGRRALLPIGVAVAVLAAVALQRMVAMPAPLLVMLALLTLGSLVGSSVGSRIEHPGHLLFVALVSAFADTFSVAHPEGPSAAIASSAQALSVLAVSWPMLGTSQIEPLLGVGDLVFTGLYVAAARAHGLSLQRTCVALALAFVFTMIVVIVTQLPVPALPFMGIAMLVAHPRTRIPPEKDRKRGVAATCALCLMFGALLARRML